MNRGQLVFECSRALGLDDTVGGDELTLMQRWANRGVVDVLTRTLCYTDLGDMTLAAGTTDYRIDNTILAIRNIHITSATDSSQISPLEVTDMQTVDEYLDSNPAASDPTMVAFYDTLLRVAPVPSGNNVLRFYYVPKPTEMTADGTNTADANDPSTATYGGIPSEYHDAILYYMLWQAAQYDQQGGGFFRGHSFAPGSAFKGVYDDWCAEIRKRSRRKGGKGINRARLGYPRTSRFPYTRNDVYPPYSR